MKSTQCLALLIIVAGGPLLAGPLEYAAAPADNPLKGFVPYARPGRDFPHSLEFSYLPLRDLMTGPDRFDWTPLEKLLDEVAGRGCQTIFRVWLEYPGKPSGVPKYLIDQGLKIRTWTNTNTQPFPSKEDHTPDYEDPRLRAAFKAFIAALGARYDGDPRIGGITAGLLGTWGEWHCHPHSEWFASKTVQTEVMDAYQAAFRKTPILLRYPAGNADARFTANADRPFGYHDDSFAWATLDTGRKQDGWFYVTRLRQAGPAALERWRTHPIGGEIRPELWPKMWTAAGPGQGQDYFRCVEETHATWLMESSTSRKLTPEDRGRAIKAAQKLGYELFVASANPAIKADKLEIALEVRNTGVAPFYADWPVELALLDEAGKVARTWKPAWSPAGIQPGQTAAWEHEASLADIAAGRYHVAIRVPNPMPTGRPLRFANATQDQHAPGWLTLGEYTRP